MILKTKVLYDIYYDSNILSHRKQWNGSLV